MDSLLGPSGYAVWEDTPPLLRPALSGEERAPSAEGCVPPLLDGRALRLAQTRRHGSCRGWKVKDARPGRHFLPRTGKA